MKSVVELNNLSLKLFRYVMWFDQRQNRRPCKRGSIEDNSKGFIVKITKTILSEADLGLLQYPRWSAL